MRLAKPCFDIGLATNNLEPMLQFWQTTIGLEFDHRLKIRAGLEQHRHNVAGSVLKINHWQAALPPSPPSGYTELLIARSDVSVPKSFVDPDGNRVALVPRGHRHVQQIGVRLRVRDLKAHQDFYSRALGLADLPDDGGATFQAGDSLILVEQDDNAPLEAPFEGHGWRYITLQVFAVDTDTNVALAAGGWRAAGDGPRHPGNDRPVLNDQGSCGQLDRAVAARLHHRIA